MQEKTRRRILTRRSRFRQKLLPYASDSALTGLQIIFLFSVFHDFSLIKMGLYLLAVIIGARGSVPLLRTLLGKTANQPFSLAVLQRALPSVLLLAWGESHLLQSSYIPFNRLAVLVWLVYVGVGLFFGAVRSSHRARLLRDERQAEQEWEIAQQQSTIYNTVDARDTEPVTPRYPLAASPAAAESEALVAGRS